MKTKTKPLELKVDAQTGVSDERMLAKTVLRPTVQAAITTQRYNASDFGTRDLTELATELHSQTEAVSAGNLGRAEAMLTAQAHTLDAIFNKLARMALTADYMNQTESYLKLALRAQNQARSTWETISRLQNPAVYMRQTNIAHNQQVNNQPTKAQNELLEQQNGERLDFGTTAASGRGDTTVETVGAVNRAEDAKRQTHVSDECL